MNRTEEAQRRERVMIWQPIETAPKDGTEVLGVFVKQWDWEKAPSVYGPWTVAFRNKRWMASYDGMSVVEYMSDFGTDYMEAEIDPTHWMPLPDPPETEQERETDGETPSKTGGKP